MEPDVNADNVTPPTQENPSKEQEIKPKQQNDMLASIAEAVKGSTSEVRQRFIDLQVEQGKQKRVDMLVKAFEEKNNLKKELDRRRFLRNNAP